ncbi:hypothetical protein M3689_02695 [Alkalihalophilus marmarensis]|jgi:hypothetical protein|uniref:hypothetical protein n=1 Tax=Alkalihalophilus marmarensis TaxID=521377 RepID=UPI00203E5BE9|nr:hypothetical protein [Alkalihalophilus marmarensis]MCM3488212.1 hypothetical protein [Alkalihalophilus marmarensis]
MNLFFDLTWTVFPFILAIAAVLGLTILFSMFIKNRYVLGAAVGLIVLSGIIIVNQAPYTSFSAEFSNHINQNSTIDKIEISAYTTAGDHDDEGISITVFEEDTIERILSDLDQMTLKETRHYEHPLEYSITFFITNEIGDRQYQTKTTTYYMNETYFDQYEITSDSNHLQTIEYLFNKIR